MRLLALALAMTLGLAAGCDRNKPVTPPSPKTDTTSSIAPSAAGGSAPVTSSRNDGAGNREDNRNGSNPHAQQVDPNRAAQRRDFQSNDDGAGPRSADTAPKGQN